MVKQIKTSQIRIDGNTQSRAEINNDAVQEYAQAIKDGAEFPPVKVMFDGADYWLYDGFHRFHANNTAGNDSISAEVSEGSLRDAILLSLGENQEHGIRRTNADKRKAVTTLLHDKEWSAWSDKNIATRLGVSREFVNRIKHELVSTEENHTCDRSQVSNQSDRKFIHPKTGKESVMNVSSIGKNQPEAKQVAPQLVNKPKQESELSAQEQAQVDADLLAQEKEFENWLENPDNADLMNRLKQKEAMNTVLRRENDGIQHKNAELARYVKSANTKIEKLEKHIKELERELAIAQGVRVAA